MPISIQPSSAALTPPFRFAPVEPDVHRGAYPKPRNLRFLQRLRLKTVIALIPKGPEPHMVEWCQGEGVELVHFAVKKPKEEISFPSALMNQIILTMTDPSRLPIYVHCLDGTRIAGLVIGCLRKLQCWSLPSILSEYTRFAEMEDDDRKFLERYSGDFLFPDRPCPPWLWPGGRNWKSHPLLRARFEEDEALAAAKAEEAKAASRARREAFRARILADLLRDPVKVRRERAEAEGKAQEERERQRGRVETVHVSRLILALSLHGLDI